MITIAAVGCEWPQDSVCILHYISCGFSWWQHKYKLLGCMPAERKRARLVVGLNWWRIFTSRSSTNGRCERIGFSRTFQDAWFGGALPIPKCFHTQSRDLVGSGDEARARQFYENTVVIADGASALLSRGVTAPCRPNAGISVVVL